MSKREKLFFRDVVKDGDIVFDVGCRSDNTFYEINQNLELHLFDPLEPDKKLFGKFNQIALGASKYKADYHPEYSSLLKREELKGERWKHLTHKSYEVDVDTVDNYCLINNIKKIKLLKIDAEGYDYEVLLGAKDMLRNIQYITFESWEGKTKKIIKFLEQNGFMVAILGGAPMIYYAKKKA